MITRTSVLALALLAAASLEPAFAEADAAEQIDNIRRMAPQTPREIRQQQYDSQRILMERQRAEREAARLRELRRRDLERRRNRHWDD